MLPDILRRDGIIKYRQEFLDKIDFLKQNFRNVRLGTQHFTAMHITAACKAFNINANWIVGTEKNIYRTK